MFEIIWEALRAAMVGLVLWVLLREGRRADISRVSGWRYIKTGAALVFFGAWIDITDNYENLNRFVFIGNTPGEAFLEKVVGYALGCIILTYGITRWLPKFIRRHESIRVDLQQANTQLKVLSGLLPICASCKKIRDDAGGWTQLETYIHNHSEAQFSHCICPDCMQKLYPEYASAVELEGNRGSLKAGF